MTAINFYSIELILTTFRLLRRSVCEVLDVWLRLLPSSGFSLSSFSYYLMVECIFLSRTKITFSKIPTIPSGTSYLLDCCYPFLTHNVPYAMFLTRNVHATPPPLRPLTRLTTRRFPPKLRSMCHCLYQVVTQRFQQSTVEAVWTVIGTVVFLRFINPALGIPLHVCVLCVHMYNHVCTLYIRVRAECYL